MSIAMVGYYNTLPFLFGLKNTDTFDLILDIPSRCMDYYSSGRVDIALVPVATLLDRSDYDIVSDYCIGCVGSVRTVCLFTNGDLNEVTHIFLDQDSRTSQLLVKNLCERSWGINPTFEECNAHNLRSENLRLNEAVLMIGDKVFDKEKAFKHRYDLGVEWQKLTDLPFAFAVWIARKGIDLSIIESLNQALGQGVSNIDEVLASNKTIDTKIDLAEYFEKHIDFYFDEDKNKAFNLFSEYASTLSRTKEKIEM